MKTFFRVLLICICVGYSSFVFSQNSFDTWFEKKTLRIDFDLSGDVSAQAAAVRALREEPVWAGPVTNLIDPFGYGGYYVHVYDKSSGELIYSRGFNTLFEEWRTTEQALSEKQSWTNTIAVPYPKQTIRVALLARERSTLEFAPLLTVDVDPESIFIDRRPLKKNETKSILKNGEIADKVDLVFLAEGYTAAEQDKFFRDAERFTGYLFDTPPFDTRKSDFNVWAVGLVSEDAGTSISGEGIYKNTALNSGYYTFGVDRYLTTPDMKTIRDAVWDVPCDAIFILVNTDRYGGGGMYNFYAIGTSDNERTPHVFVHEFGHSFAGLADEYFSSEVAYTDFYSLAHEPWEPNITTLIRFDDKWQDLLMKGTPVPTPLEPKYSDKLGVFEGGGYVAKGIYRPMDHCMMRDYAPFCPVCSRAILQMIDFLTGK